MTPITTKPHVHIDYGWTGRRYQPGEVDLIMNSPTMLAIACWTGRIGAAAFLVQLELEYFPPVGPVNDQLHVAHVKWPEANDDPMNAWMVMAVPMQFRSIAEHVAEQNSMRIADGVPTMIEPDGEGLKTTFFPFQGPNVFHLENETESAIYDNKPKTREELSMLEFMRVGAIRQEFNDKYAPYLAEIEKRKRAGQYPVRPVGTPLNRQQRRDQDRRNKR